MMRYRGFTYMWCLGFAGGGDGSSGTWRGQCGALCEGRGGRREAWRPHNSHEKQAEAALAPLPSATFCLYDFVLITCPLKAST